MPNGKKINIRKDSQVKKYIYLLYSNPRMSKGKGINIYREIESVGYCFTKVKFFIAPKFFLNILQLSFEADKADLAQYF